MNEQAKNLALSTRRNSLILRKGCNLSWGLQHNLSICSLKIFFFLVLYLVELHYHLSQ